MPGQQRGKRERQRKSRARRASVVEPKPERRSCGGCTACCRSLAVDELDKPEWASCPNQLAEGDHGGGCGAYNDRPASCRAFSCCWLTGLKVTTTDHRPDRCGVVLIPTDNPKVVQARELWEAAATRGAGGDLVAALRRGGIMVVVISPRGRRDLQPLTLFGAPVVSV